jgi:predicted metalloprotease
MAFGALILGLATWFLLANAQKQGNSPRNQQQAISSLGARPTNPPADPLTDFVSSILGDTEDVWLGQFRMMEQAYKEPPLVLFTGQIRSACGLA